VPTITLLSLVDKNLSSPFTVQDLKDKYLAGLPIPDSITNDTLQFFVDASITEIESFLGLKISKQIIEESKDFFRDDWVQWGYVGTTYPVICPLSLLGFLGTVQQITYPTNWLSSKKTSDGKWYSRMIHIVPTANSTASEALIYSGIVPQIGYMGSKNIPNYWRIKYTTGWDKPPLDIINAIGMLSASKVLGVISDALMVGQVRQTVNAQGQTVLTNNGGQFQGMGLGIASKSISLDGLSQSTSSYVNGQTSVWGARLKQYADMLDCSKPGTLMSRLYDNYAALTMGVG